MGATFQCFLLWQRIAYRGQQGGIKTRSIGKNTVNSRTFVSVVELIQEPWGEREAGARLSEMDHMANTTLRIDVGKAPARK